MYVYFALALAAVSLPALQTEWTQDVAAVFGDPDPAPATLPSFVVPGVLHVAQRLAEQATRWRVAAVSPVDSAVCLSVEGGHVVASASCALPPTLAAALHATNLEHDGELFVLDTDRALWAAPSGRTLEAADSSLPAGLARLGEAWRSVAAASGDAAESQCLLEKGPSRTLTRPGCAPLPFDDVAHADISAFAVQYRLDAPSSSRAGEAEHFDSSRFALPVPPYISWFHERTPLAALPLCVTQGSDALSPVSSAAQQQLWDQLWPAGSSQWADAARADHAAFCRPGGLGHLVHEVLAGLATRDHTFAHELDLAPLVAFLESDAAATDVSTQGARRQSLVLALLALIDGLPTPISAAALMAGYTGRLTAHLDAHPEQDSACARATIAQLASRVVPCSVADTACWADVAAQLQSSAGEPLSAVAAMVGVSLAASAPGLVACLADGVEAGPAALCPPGFSLRSGAVNGTPRAFCVSSGLAEAAETRWPDFWLLHHHDALDAYLRELAGSAVTDAAVLTGDFVSAQALLLYELVASGPRDAAARYPTRLLSSRAGSAGLEAMLCETYFAYVYYAAAPPSPALVPLIPTDYLFRAPLDGLPALSGRLDVSPCADGANVVYDDAAGRAWLTCPGAAVSEDADFTGFDLAPFATSCAACAAGAIWQDALTGLTFCHSHRVTARPLNASAFLVVQDARGGCLPSALTVAQDGVARAVPAASIAPDAELGGYVVTTDFLPPASGDRTLTLSCALTPQDRLAMDPVELVLADDAVRLSASAEHSADGGVVTVSVAVAGASERVARLALLLSHSELPQSLAPSCAAVSPSVAPQVLCLAAERPLSLDFFAWVTREQPDAVRRAARDGVRADVAAYDAAGALLASAALGRVGLREGLVPAPNVTIEANATTFEAAFAPVPGPRPYLTWFTDGEPPAAGASAFPYGPDSLLTAQQFTLQAQSFSFAPTAYSMALLLDVAGHEVLTPALRGQLRLDAGIPACPLSLTASAGFVTVAGGALPVRSNCSTRLAVWFAAIDRAGQSLPLDDPDWEQAGVAPEAVTGAPAGLFVLSSQPSWQLPVSGYDGFSVVRQQVQARFIVEREADGARFLGPVASASLTLGPTPARVEVLAQAEREGFLSLTLAADAVPDPGLNPGYDRALCQVLVAPQPEFTDADADDALSGRCSAATTPFCMACDGSKQLPLSAWYDGAYPASLSVLARVVAGGPRLELVSGSTQRTVELPPGLGPAPQLHFAAGRRYELSVEPSPSWAESDAREIFLVAKVAEAPQRLSDAELDAAVLAHAAHRRPPCGVFVASSLSGSPVIRLARWPGSSATLSVTARWLVQRGSGNSSSVAGSLVIRARRRAPHVRFAGSSAVSLGLLTPSPSALLRAPVALSGDTVLALPGSTLWLGALCPGEALLVRAVDRDAPLLPPDPDSLDDDALEAWQVRGPDAAWLPSAAAVYAVRGEAVLDVVCWSDENVYRQLRLTVAASAPPGTVAWLADAAVEPRCRLAPFLGHSQSLVLATPERPFALTDARHVEAVAASLRSFVLCVAENGTVSSRRYETEMVPVQDETLRAVALALAALLAVVTGLFLFACWRWPRCANCGCSFDRTRLARPPAGSLAEFLLGAAGKHALCPACVSGLHQAFGGLAENIPFCRLWSGAESPPAADAQDAADCTLRALVCQE